MSPLMYTEKPFSKGETIRGADGYEYIALDDSRPIEPTDDLPDAAWIGSIKYAVKVEDIRRSWMYQEKP